MNYLKPTLKLSFGVASVVTIVLIFSYSFRFFLHPKAVTLANRATECEQLAVNCSLNVSQGHPKSVEYLVTAICQREEEILSGAVRTAKADFSMNSATMSPAAHPNKT